MSTTPSRRSAGLGARDNLPARMGAPASIMCSPETEGGANGLPLFTANPGDVAEVRHSERRLLFLPPIISRVRRGVRGSPTSDVSYPPSPPPFGTAHGLAFGRGGLNPRRRSCDRGPSRGSSRGEGPRRSGTIARPRRRARRAGSGAAAAAGRCRSAANWWLWVTNQTSHPASASAVTTWRAISAPSRSFVDDRDSLSSTRLPGVHASIDHAEPAQLLVELAALHAWRPPRG